MVGTPKDPSPQPENPPKDPTPARPDAPLPPMKDVLGVAQAKKQKKHHTDIQQHSWLMRRAPAALHPYILLARLDRPIGIWLLLLPCWWGLALARNATADTALIAQNFILFAIGATLMRSAGCIINDMWDRKLDAQVERTAHRPLACGALSMRQAIMALLFCLCGSFAIFLTLNTFAMLVTVAALPFVVLYPAMKRITYWPQLFLGITFNWGILLAWASITGSLHPPAVALYCGAIFWTIAYDTIYAHQDKDDDLAAGIKSSALALGEHTKAFLVMAYILFIISIAASIYLSDLGWQSYLGLFPLAGIFAWQIKDLDIDDQQSCLTHFRLNRFIGLLVTFTLMLGWFHLPI